MKFEKKTHYSFVEHEVPLRLIRVSTVKVEPFDRSVHYRGPPFFTFSVSKCFFMKKMEKRNSQQLPHINFDFTNIGKIQSQSNK